MSYFVRLIFNLFNDFIMKDKAVWISFDLGIGGDYPGLYRWLANHKAVECGDSVAFFHYSAPDNEDFVNEIRRDLESSLKVDSKTRIYCIRKLNGKVKGSFIFGSRKGNPWEGYGDVDRGIEEGE